MTPVSNRCSDYGGGNGASTDYVQELKRSKDNTPTYVTTTYAEYTFWGRAGRITDPNTKSVCKTYDASFGLPATSRIVIDGNQTSCGTSGSNDQTTSYTYDSHRRLTRTTRPRLNCIANTYDSDGRLSTTALQDYVSGACTSTANTTAYTYAQDGELLKTEWKDSGGTVKRSREVTRSADRRVATEKNPVDTSKVKTWSYDPDGAPAEVQFEDYSQSNARTQWDVDNLNRETAMRRYTGASSNEAFAFTPGAQQDSPTAITDPASHAIDLKWDDMRRKASETTPEGGQNIFLYDEAGNLTTMVLAYNTTDTKTATYTYDNMNRLLTADNGNTNCSGGSVSHAELQYFYDAVPGQSGSPGCPGGSNCNLLSGRLAAAKVVIYCDSNGSDGSFDQWTLYSYTEAGLTAEHTVVDDGSRNGRVVYTYDKNQNTTRIDYPSGSTTGMVNTYSSSNASDDDRVVTIARDTTTALDSIVYTPWGPRSEYRQQNRFTHSHTIYSVKQTFTYNLAYRLSSIYARSTFSTSDDVFKIDYAEDNRQRYTKRDFSYGTGSQKDMFFLYDNLNRTTCRTPTSQASCPTSGANQIETLTYNTSSDRTQLILTNNLIATTTYNYVYASSTTDRLSCIYYGTASSCASGSNVISYAYDTRGNRTADDDNTYTGTSNDARTYTYDGRNNLITVTGKFYYAASTLNDYLITYAYDERNRIIFKSFKDTTANVEAQWFFYYDQDDRLLEAKYTPNISSSGTYSVFQWYWLDDLAFLYYQIDFPAATTTRRYLHSDEQGRPHDAWSWPSAADTTRVWEVEAGLFGWDIPTVGSTIYQPLRFPGQKYDADTEAITLNGSVRKLLRAGLSDNRYRAYDAFCGAYYQLDPKVGLTGDVYGYANQSPALFSDPDGRIWFLPILAAIDAIASIVAGVATAGAIAAGAYGAFNILDFLTGGSHYDSNWDPGDNALNNYIHNEGSMHGGGGGAANTCVNINRPDQAYVFDQWVQSPHGSGSLCRAFMRLRLRAFYDACVACCGGTDTCVCHRVLDYGMLLCE